jgi:hypothetical protein
LSWNYTAFLNIGFAGVALGLIARFAATGGPEMLRMMSMPQDEPSHEKTSNARR